MKALLLITPLLATLACQGKGVTREDVDAVVKRLPAEGLQKLARRRVYFGHQSVGQNIAEGIAQVARLRPEAGLRLLESRAPDALATPGIAHALNGRNHEPLTKITDFSETLRVGMGGAADIALFKFCYVDFPPGTDVDRVFAEYRSALAALRLAHPKVRFVHVTSPLTIVQTGPKALVKSLLGRPLWGADANQVRERFNELLRREYQGKEPFFDLAAVESRRPNGETATFRAAGRTWPALAPEYSSDGKHLNELGSRWVAAHLLEALASVD
ncbi:MAG: SGNH/GDSL hydrolase family protein [Deltaproteobacteria bacterium]|nr:SGNH/GDSL hydrolase family protein [Deltaproteobacteria bacterium]